jgi:uncharacterized tellurite resistance protein B-like protein
MTPTQNLHYALGELAYAVAFADGTIQQDERKKFHAILESEMTSVGGAPDISEIIFKLLEKDKTDSETSYQWALGQLKLNSQYLSPELKLAFLRVIEKIAKAFPPVLHSEKNMIQRLRNDISEIHGDPVFYAAHT